MGYACICRSVREEEVDLIMEDLDPQRPVTDEDISDHFDSGYVCGTCQEVFEKKAEQHNERLEERQRTFKKLPVHQVNENDPAFEPR